MRGETKVASTRDGDARGRTHTGTVRNLFVSLRPHQWTKNLLVFAGAVFSGSLSEPDALVSSVEVFVAFCLASSAVYLFNDLRDLPCDRLHPHKRNRPLAAGYVTRAQAWLSIVILSAAAFGLAALTDGSTVGVLATYLALNLAYTLVLKHVVILDVLAVSLGFVIRAVAGAVAIGVESSPWLVLCTLMLAMLLSFGKRWHELSTIGDEQPGHRLVLQSYSLGYLELMMGISAAAAIVMYTLYTMAPSTVGRFGSRGLVMTVPFVVYGVSRYLYLVRERGDGGDPALLLVTDRGLVCNSLLWAAVCFVVIYGPADWLQW